MARRPILFSILIGIICFSSSCKKFEPQRKTILRTTKVSTIGSTTCSIQGECVDLGSPADRHGFCYSSWSEEPTVNNDLVADLGELREPGSIVAQLSGLYPGNYYYIRTFAFDRKEVHYGNVLEFSTGAVYSPSVSTSRVTNITARSAEVSGSVDYTGGATIVEKGFYYGTNPEADAKKVSLGSDNNGFTLTIRDLFPSTMYYVKAYAKNSLSSGEGLGEIRSFTTLPDISDNTVTDIDGNVYNTVRIGDQVWMAENLRTTKYSDGTEIQLLEDRDLWNNKDYNAKAYCWYDNDISNKADYGALYTWPAAMNGSNSSNSNPSIVRGVCPDGWHLPSDEEWKELETFLGMSDDEADREGEDRGTNEGGKLKEAGTSHWISPNVGASNESGFTALPGSARGNLNWFPSIGYLAQFWSSTDGINRRLDFDKEGIFRHHMTTDIGLSVRCVKD